MHRLAAPTLKGRGAPAHMLDLAVYQVIDGIAVFWCGDWYLSYTLSNLRPAFPSQLKSGVYRRNGRKTRSLAGLIWEKLCSCILTPGMKA